MEVIIKEIKSEQELKEIDFSSIKFVRTGASEEHLSFYTLSNGKIIIYSENGVLSTKEKAKFFMELEEKCKLARYYLGLGHSLKMQYKYYQPFCKSYTASGLSYAATKNIIIDLLTKEVEQVKNRTKESVVKSVILGHAVGDAFGLPVEFEEREKLIKKPVTKMGKPPYLNLPIGSWSDDTSMSLCALKSLSKGKIDYEDIMQNFCKWYSDGEFTPTGYTFGVGLICEDAIQRYYKGTSPTKCGGTGEYDNGNGSLMRINPFVLYLYYKDMPIEKKINIIHKASSLTHAHKRSQIGCGIYAFVLWSVLNNPTKEGLIKGLIDAAKFYKDEPELNNYATVFDAVLSLKKEDVKSSGYVVDTLEAAIWCLANTVSYSECVKTAVNLGGDTDTIAAVCGGIAGAMYGIDEEGWLSLLVKKDEIEKMCSEFASVL